MRRKIRIAGWSMVWSGIFLLAFAGWQLYGTGISTARAQTEARAVLADTFEQRRAEPVQPKLVTVATSVSAGTTTVTNPTPEPVELYPEDPVPEGEPFGVIRIPKIGLDVAIFEGVDPETLKKGPGHMPWTPLPGQPGNAVISGHRTTYGAPFFDLDLLEPGDIIEVETAIGLHRYEVRETIIVDPTDVWVTENRRGAWLTLTTCAPKYSARQRLIIFAELVEGPNYEFAQAAVEAFLQDVG